MKSTKKIHLDHDNTILFTYINKVIYIIVTIDSNIIKLIQDESEFINILQILQEEYNINIHSINLIKKWFDKNMIKHNPIKEYTTRYGRIIKYYSGSDTISDS